MEQLIVEVGLKLDKSLNYYKKLLKKNGLMQVFKCKTHDIYYTKEKSFDGLSENQIKNSCIRIRNPKKIDKIKEEQLINEGYFKVFDTVKKDYHYKTETMKSIVQLQVVKKIGLVVYYDNPDYYTMPAELQWKSLVDELNSYGFNLRHDEQGIDKLRTFLLGYDCYSYNQNG